MEELRLRLGRVCPLLDIFSDFEFTIVSDAKTEHSTEPTKDV